MYVSGSLTMNALGLGASVFALDGNLSPAAETEFLFLPPAFFAPSAA